MRPRTSSGASAIMASTVRTLMRLVTTKTTSRATPTSESHQGAEVSAAMTTEETMRTSEPTRPRRRRRIAICAARRTSNRTASRWSGVEIWSAGSMGSPARPSLPRRTTRIDSVKSPTPASCTLRRGSRCSTKRGTRYANQPATIASQINPVRPM